MRNLIFCLVLSMVFAYLPLTAQKTIVPDTSPYLSAFKVAPLGPMVGNYGLTYERGAVFKDNISLEMNVGYRTSPLLFRGWIRDSDTKVNGFYGSAGPKIYFGKQEFTMEGMRRTHPMFGWYFKPELGFRYTVFSNPDNDDVTATVVKLLLNIGKQWISDKFVFEIYTGIGYAYRNYNRTNNSLFDDISDDIRENFPIAAQSGIRLGLLTR
ncbi:MAG: hypothetical protein IPM47_19675 [Sphingobacteriales bacterium]|nr:MAG: hypothetical protein IPM47_19675 [Sphingobacteriales bacterium]